MVFKLYNVMKKIFLIVFLGIFVFSGCETQETQFLKFKNEKEAELGKLQSEFHQKLTQQKEELEKSTNKIIFSQKEQMQAAADSFYGQSIVFKTIKTDKIVQRPILILENFSTEGWAALGNLMPSYDAMLKINQRVNDELDETKTSLADLQKSHDTVLADNIEKSKETIRLTKEVEDLKKQIEKDKEDYGKRLSDAQNSLNDANNKLIAIEKKRADQSIADAKARHKMFTKISSFCGVISLLCCVMVIWGPAASKTKFAIMGALAAFSAVGIWYITPLFVGIIFAAGVGLCILWILYEHQKTVKEKDAALSKEKELSSHLILAMQNYKETYSADWDKVSPLIEEQLKKYVEKDGKITTEENQELKLMIDKRLAEFQRK